MSQMSELEGYEYSYSDATADYFIIIAGSCKSWLSRCKDSHASGQLVMIFVGVFARGELEERDFLRHPSRRFHWLHSLHSKDHI